MSAVNSPRSIFMSNCLHSRVQQLPLVADVSSDWRYSPMCRQALLVQLIIYDRIWHSCIPLIDTFIIVHWTLEYFSQLFIMPAVMEYQPKKFIKIAVYWTMENESMTLTSVHIAKYARVGGNSSLCKKPLHRE